MPPSTWACDLQDVRALAHRLYCSCQEPSSVYKPLARSIRTLRNKLEEADDALDETSVRAEEIEVLQAAGGSKIVLSRLERACKRQQKSSAGTAYAEEDAITDLLNDIDEVTRKLSTALEALEHSNGNIGLSPNYGTHSSQSSTQTPMSPSSMTTNSEDGNAISTGSSSWSFSTKPASFPHRLSANSQSVPDYDCEPEQEKQVAPSHQMVGPHSGSVGSMGTPPSLKSDRWSQQFAYFDPMSVDIDSASSLILGTRPSPKPPALMARSPARIGSPAVTGAPAPSDTAIRVLPGDTTGDVGSYIARSASLRGASLLARTERNGRISSSASLRRSPGSTRVGATQHATSASRAVVTESQTPIQEQIRTSTHRAADSILDDLGSLQPSSSPLARNSTRIRDRILSRSAPAAKSRYRIVNLEKDDLSRTDSARFVDSPASFSTPSTPSSPAEPGRRAFAGFTPSLYKIDSLPISCGRDEEHHGYHEVESGLDTEIINAIISSWNAGQWDQAKHNIELLASQHSENRNGKLSRRLKHLLGVIASLSGQLGVALTHFLAVFPEVIEDLSQLDIGHCAAACWMGDIYALLNRKTEAILAYSVAARTPLATDPTWLPLQQQLIVERDTCRSGDVKTGINMSASHDPKDDDKGTDTILDPKIIARDVARTIMQADNQPAGRDTRKLDSNRSRAMAIHDSGFMPGSWQERHKLGIDATAFEPSQFWPLPFDPFFVLENVQRHRLSTPASDLLRSGLSAAKIPKKSRLAFSCQDLRWLIVTLRSSLTKSEIEWSEVIIDYGPKFLARYKVVGDGISTSHFFSIPIYRLSFRPGYGVDICSDGIFSSRIQNVEPKSEKGVHGEEVKRVKKVIKEALEMAAKRQEATESKSMSMTLPVMSINGVTSLHKR